MKRTVRNLVQEDPGRVFKIKEKIQHEVIIKINGEKNTICENGNR